jgi:hypothetical protein
MKSSRAMSITRRANRSIWDSSLSYPQRCNTRASRAATFARTNQNARAYHACRRHHAEGVPATLYDLGRSPISNAESVNLSNSSRCYCLPGQR